jgi:REP element-mobilizing transposase RayT
MEFNPKMPHRRSVRLREYDYASPGQYFVTVCTDQRVLLLGEVLEGQMRRNALGDIVHAEWFATERIRPEIRLDAFIVMPNHFHGIIEITPVGARRCLALQRRIGPTGRPSGPAPGSIGAILGQIKSLSKKAINKIRATPGRPVWQPNYHEHIIRNERELNRIREYICNNPLRWPSDRENPERQADTPDEIADIVSWDDDPWEQR